MIIVTQDEQSPDPAEVVRMQSHYGPTGPVAVVYEWLGHIKGGEYATAWSLMDDQLRLCRAQAWLWNNRHTPDIALHNLDAAAESLAASPSQSLLWPSFASTELNQLHETWERHFTSLDAETLGAASHTRVIGPDLELVVLVDLGKTAPVTFDKPTLLPDAFLFTVRMTGKRWRIAAYGDKLPTPGWPPVFGPPLG